MTARKATKFATAALATGVLAAIAAGPASAATTHYETNYSSAYGAVRCHGRLVINKNYPGTELEGHAVSGGKETERCTSTEPSGKLTGYFEPGEEYTGYWESDYYATIGKDGVQPSSVLIKVGKKFKAFRVVYAIYPNEGGSAT